MSLLRKKWLVYAWMLISLPATSSVAFADETSSISPATSMPPAPATTPPVTPDTQSGTGAAALSGTAAPDSIPAAPPVRASANFSAPVAPEAGPGPLQDQRKALLARISAAQKQGIGTGTYMGEFNRIEEMVKAGQPASAYESRISSLSGNLDEQIKRSQILKTQRPVPPVVRAQQPGKPGGNQHTFGHNSNGLAGDPLVDKLKQKYGNQIPGGIGALDKLGPEDREKLLQSDVGKQLMKKFLGN